MKGLSDSYTATTDGWGIHVLIVVAVLLGLIAFGYWLRGQIDAERRAERTPRCPRCDRVLTGPRPIPERGRR